jgi:hypothetical protein
MRTFTCLISDARYTVPTLALYVTTDEATARKLAMRDLKANPNHEACELREGDRLVFTTRQPYRVLSGGGSQPARASRPS